MWAVFSLKLKGSKNGVWYLWEHRSKRIRMLKILERILFRGKERKTHFRKNYMRNTSRYKNHEDFEGSWVSYGPCYGDRWKWSSTPPTDWPPWCAPCAPVWPGPLGLLSLTLFIFLSHITYQFFFLLLMTLKLKTV